MNTLLSDVKYILPPKSFFKKIPASIIRPDIPLPISPVSNPAAFNPADITIEALQAGFLIVAAYDRSHKDLSYFKDLFLELQPNALQEITNIALIKINNEQYDVAEQLLRALEGFFPHDAGTLLNLAILMEERAAHIGLDHTQRGIQYILEAEQRYTVLAQSDTPLPSALLNGGFFFARQKKFAQAENFLERYIQTNESKKEQMNGRKEKATALLNEIRRQGLSDQHFANARNYAETGNYEEAAQNIHLFLTEHPQSWNGWFLLGWILRFQKHWDSARASFEQSLVFGKKNPETFESAAVDLYNELAICSMELGMFDTATQYLLEALKKEPENTKIISNLGVVAMREDRVNDARGFFKTVLEITPDDPIARTMLTRLDES